VVTWRLHAGYVSLWLSSILPRLVLRTRTPGPGLVIQGYGKGTIQKAVLSPSQ
jgi:hypothetical protein